MRRAARKDSSQEAIVKALRQAGCKVEIIGRPVDLLVRYWSSIHRHFLWTPMECKTPTKTGKRRKRTDQEKQDAYIEENCVPVVKTPDEALRAVGL